MKIIIPGIPVPQARMKHSNRRGFVTTYDPKAKEKSLIRHILEASRNLNSLDFPRISFLFHMPIPASIPKKQRSLYESGKLKHDKKPDVDNLIKLYLDCLDGIVIQGDQKVSLGPCLKIYHPEPKTVIWIHDTTQTVTPWELDVAFLDGEEPEIPCFCVQDYPFGSCDLWTQVRSLFAHTNDQDYIDPTLGKLAIAHSLQG
jgi:Holliday junction resolvase RusA-like endonuclease